MPDTKITALTAIGANPIIPATFPIPMVDLTDTSMAASGTTKKVTVNQILGAGGTATLASATITGDLTVDTSTLKVDSTNNRVGIGTATPGTRFVVSGGRTGLFSADAFSLALAQTSGQANYAYLGTDASGNLLFSESSGSTIMTLSQSGNLALANGNLVMSTSGKGIDFSATSSGSGTMTSELLNDYEEGTWTGSLLGGNINPTTPITATGRYTKVGRLVTLQINFDNVNTSGASGKVFVNGIPFANAGFSTYGSAASYLAATFSGTLTCNIDANEPNAIVLMDIKSNAAWATADHNAGAGRYVRLTITYTV